MSNWRTGGEHRMPWYYVVEDYPAGPEINKPVSLN